MKLSILDQSRIKEDGGAIEALQETVRLAELADRLGYTRFWVSEHHSGSLAHSSPELLMGNLAARTSRIRIGSGGVMLPHYSAYKVAENARLLEALHPGRIDLGIGRAPGGMPASKRALQEYKVMPEDWYDRQIRDLLHYLNIRIEEKHRFGDLIAMPDINTAPSVWLLGGSAGSAGLAAYHGIGFAYAQFIRGEKDAAVLDMYRKSYRNNGQNPQMMVSLFLFCAETTEAAEALAKSHEVASLLQEQGRPVKGMLRPETAADYKLSPYEKERLEDNRPTMVIGTAAEVLQQLEELEDYYSAEVEFMLTSPVYEEKARQDGFRLLMEAYNRRSYSV
ncbi:luciferase family oxidoreductase, group 1 [Terribacillus halophilus]|uniref:Luciferase family oxidoreductase, group 1 n=1 Tax=Terribacillus halophilus TaxID=361279 RepID=A0A1G6HYV7_9BACI|nr:LLM class flavin-dependent oxidoreductase [Terribacillus halophilus]SDB99323.1 luciferase family oxidoreductase, group 1 [Terribacillus halophilus]